MLSMTLLEETGAGPGSIWVPILVLGWFLLMTLVGWQASKRQNAGTESPAADTTHSGSNPSEFDHH
jgi:hypothetical protein